MSSVEKIRPVIESKLKDLGFELFDFRFFHAGSRSILRVTVDSENGVTISDCENISNELSVLLDVENFSAGRPYNLEVSSPGIDRQLRTEKDFRRTIGRDVVLHLTEGIEGKKTIRGRVVKCEGNKLTIMIEHNTVEIPLSDIYSGKEEIRFK
ncbi:MAG: ribosome maturation factor RimP [Fibrobacter sp.]|mgnify:FL=1|jgi:ribosome maturation factor RimP|nr:ribosome maturation factor RimP [Fibrobacter sp.]